MTPTLSAVNVTCLAPTDSDDLSATARCWRDILSVAAADGRTTCVVVGWCCWWCIRCRGTTNGKPSPSLLRLRIRDSGASLCRPMACKLVSCWLGSMPSEMRRPTQHVVERGFTGDDTSWPALRLWGIVQDTVDVEDDASASCEESEWELSTDTRRTDDPVVARRAGCVSATFANKLSAVGNWEATCSGVCHIIADGSSSGFITLPTATLSVNSGGQLPTSVISRSLSAAIHVSSSQLFDMELFSMLFCGATALPDSQMSAPSTMPRLSVDINDIHRSHTH